MFTAINMTPHTAPIKILVKRFRFIVALSILSWFIFHRFRPYPLCWAASVSIHRFYP
jgi:hypothetical protein